jgi:hypothetical protein
LEAYACLLPARTPKGVPNDRNLRLVRSEAINGDDVETAGIGEPACPRQIVQRHRCNPPLFPRRYGLGSRSVPRRPPRLDLHEDDGRVVLRHDVNYSKPRAVPPCKNGKATSLQFLRGEIFPLFSECLPIRRGLHAAKKARGMPREVRNKPDPISNLELRRRYLPPHPPALWSARGEVQNESRLRRHPGSARRV